MLTDLFRFIRQIIKPPAAMQMVFCRGRRRYFFYDTRLPFGAKSSPEIFHRVTQAVRRMITKRGFHDIVVYLDDFLVIGATLAGYEHA